MSSNVQKALQNLNQATGDRQYDIRQDGDQYTLLMPGGMGECVLVAILANVILPVTCRLVEILQSLLYVAAHEVTGIRVNCIVSMLSPATLAKPTA